MTLQDFLEYLAAHPTTLIFYFSIIPFAALLAGWLDQDRGHYLPWNYIYAALIYLVSIPGIFALTLIAYLFLFENNSILETDLLTQILPSGSMVLTLVIINRNVDLDYVPGFDRLSGLLMVIAAVLALMWIIDRTRLIAFIRLEVGWVLLIFFGLLFLMRFGWRKLFGTPYRSR